MLDRQSPRHTPLPVGARQRGPEAASNNVKAFLKKVEHVERTGRREGQRRRGGRLVFAMDATASRAPTWERAMQIQAEMFRTATTLGGLEIQLVYYRGLNECRAGPWVTEASVLWNLMSRVTCAAGPTQIERILRHILSAAESSPKVNAAVFIGDCMEENIDALIAVASSLSSISIPVFLFHEGSDSTAATVFRLIASVTRGAYCHLNAASPDELRALLSAVAVYAAGGRKALLAHGRSTGGLALYLTEQMRQS